MRAALLNDLQSFTFQVTTFPTLLFVGSAGTAILASRSLPRWLGLAAVVAWISFYPPPGILAAGGIPDAVAFAALLLWLIGSSIAMLREPVVL